MIQVLAALMLMAAAAEPGDAVVKLLDGSTVSGHVASWSADSISVAGAEGSREVPRDQLLDVSWNHDKGAGAAAPLSMCLELVDGTRVAITAFTAAGRNATVETPYADKPLEISAEKIRRVELQPPSDASAAMWRKLEEREVAGDVLLVAKREGGLLDYLTGVVGNVTAEEVAFDWDGQKVGIKRAKVAAIAYFHAQPPRVPDAVCQLTLVDGSVIPTIELTLEAKGEGEGHGAVQVKTPAGVQLTLPLEKLARADFSSGKLAYLSDLKPTNVKWTPQIATPAAAALIVGYGLPRNDVSYSGSPLSLTWPDESQPSGQQIRTYTKGLALRSRTEMAYRLPTGMKRFVTTAGIDPTTARQGHVLLEIRADDRVIWEGEVDGQRPPVEIDVELGTARRLQLRVDYGRNLDYGDRLHLVEARVTK